MDSPEITAAGRDQMVVVVAPHGRHTYALHVPSTSPAQAPTVVEAVSIALALGWQMSRLFAGPLAGTTAPKIDADLPGMSALPAASLVKLGLAQVDVALEKLGTFLSGRTLPSTQAARDAAGEESPDRNEIRAAILDLHVELLIGLTAADFRLGKAYGLGRALADTTVSGPGEVEQRRSALGHQLDRHRGEVIIGWLDDLTSVLPEHAGKAVARSLSRWTEWSSSTDLAALDDDAVTATRRELHRCGQRWRAILSSEKNARDLLESDDYVAACRGVMKGAGAIAGSLLWQLRIPVAAAAVLIGVGLTLMVLDNSTAQVLAGLGTVAGGLGITWRSAAGSVGRVSAELLRPLWNAELDTAIGDRLTPVLKQGGERPRGRGRRHRTPGTETAPQERAELPAADEESGS